MNIRWIASAAAAVGVGVLAVPLLLGGRGDVHEPELMAGEGSSCKATRKANLDFTLKDMNGAPVRLADFKGQVILLNYWATWCAPCKVEIPVFIDLYSQYKDQGLVILGVSVDDDPETLREYARDAKMNYPVLVGRGQEDVLEAAGPVWGYPTSFFIGRDGSVCGKHMGLGTKDDFEKAIKPLL